jgi:hypothetical protein
LRAKHFRRRAREVAFFGHFHKRFEMIQIQMIDLA